MKRTGIVIILLFLVIMSCKKESEMYSFFRPTNEQNLKTLADGEFYSWAAIDSSILRADYFLNVGGAITSYGDTVIAYGHCWSKDNASPSIGHDFDTIYSQFILPYASSSFVSYLSNLLPNTEYNIRSFAIFGDAQGNPIDTGYNPTVTKIFTLPAIDEWFVQEGDLRPSGARFDAVAFNLGDTIFFGTGDQGQNNPTKDIWMYNPTTHKWEFLTELINIRLPVSLQYRSELTNGTGFALSFFEPSSQKVIRCIYIGLGDFEGTDLRDNKSNTMLEYNLDDGSWRETSLYSGGIKSGTVSFSIGSKAYVGTGSSSVSTSDWHVFDPVADRDGIDLTAGWGQLMTKPSDIARTGAIAFAIDGKGYFGLGMDSEGNFLKDFYEFRPDDDGDDGTWTRKADFPGEARRNASAFAVGSQGYVGTGDNLPKDYDMQSGDPFPAGTGTFSDVYRYDPFNNVWLQIRDYTLDKTINTDNPKKVTRATGFSHLTYSVGYIGFGIMPEETLQRAQEDFWKYQPWEGIGK